MTSSAQDTPSARPSSGFLDGPKAICLVLASAILPYLPCLGFGFVYDDDVVVLRNPVILHWRSVPSYFLKPVFDFYSTAQASHYYRPLVLLWLRLNHFLWGFHAWGWHLTNIALHAAVSLFVFLILRVYFRDPRWAVLGSMIFAVHPAHLETVAWVSGCTDSLMSVGLLGSFYLWIAARSSRRFQSLFCFVLALLTKETAFILPALIFFHVLLVIPGAPPSSGSRSQRLRNALREVIPYAVVAALYLAFRFFIFRGVSASPRWISHRDALLTVPAILWFYVRHLFVPVHLSVLYDFPIVHQASSPLFWAPLISLVVIILLPGWICLRRTSDNRILAAALWFFLPLAPVL